MILPHIQDLVAVCAGHGVRQVILSPGSRSAPLSLAFNAHPNIHTRVIPDERSAGFVALGMAQQLNQPVVLVCTSGSASFNYAPAIAEAYYQEIPLIVITADRPPEWVNQYDGQTIDQHHIYGRHVKKFFQLPVNPSAQEELWFSNRMINEALLASKNSPKGPIHVNVPLREPFYPLANDHYDFDSSRLIKGLAGDHVIDQGLQEELLHNWKSAKNKWIIIGQNTPDEELTNILNQIEDAVIINEVTGNQHQVRHAVTEQDLLFQKENWPKIASPDLMITLGNSLISKNLKLYLRANPVKDHWHIKSTDRINDIGMHLTRHIQADPKSILNIFTGLAPQQNRLIEANKEILSKKLEFIQQVNFGEMKAVFQTLAKAPEKVNLHLANSMAIRYANFLGVKKELNRVDCNRGTSGIDGSNSTALGASLVTDQLTLLITGDLAFFYDRNAFWNNEEKSQLRVVILNNDGGGIFHMIPGPNQQPDHEKLFLTPHGLNAKSLSSEFGFGYYACYKESDLEFALEDFFSPQSSTQIIEVFSDMRNDTAILQQLKQTALLG